MRSEVTIFLQSDTSADLIRLSDHFQST